MRHVAKVRKVVLRKGEEAKRYLLFVTLSKSYFQEISTGSVIIPTSGEERCVTTLKTAVWQTRHLQTDDGVVIQF